VQASELQHDEEQEEDDGAAGDVEILPLLPETHGAQREQVMRIAECGWRIDCVVEIRIPQSSIRNV
jgi:hypothetical protein